MCLSRAVWSDKYFLVVPQWLLLHQSPPFRIACYHLAFPSAQDGIRSVKQVPRRRVLTKDRIQKSEGSHGS